MEPMNLGSPVGSPGSPPTSPYLPSFLMGDPMSGVPLNPKSPARLGRHVSFSGTPTLSPQAATLSPPRTAGGMVRGERDATLHTAEKPNGPPTRGLYDYVEPTSVYSPYDNSAAFNWTNTSMNQSSSSAAPDPGASTWVTVFGFPPASASVILAQFSHYGNIVDTRSSRQGNWVHVRYQTRGEASRALSHNARVFGNAIMVGVVPCTDPDILNAAQQGKENVNEVSMLSTMGHPSTSMASYANTPNRSTNLASPYASPFNATYTSPGGNTSYGTPRGTGVRPLGQAYRNAQYSSEVQMARTTPQKSTSMVSKAWGLLGF